MFALVQITLWACKPVAPQSAPVGQMIWIPRSQWGCSRAHQCSQQTKQTAPWGKTNLNMTALTLCSPGGACTSVLTLEEPTLWLVTGTVKQISLKMAQLHHVSQRAAITSLKLAYLNTFSLWTLYCTASILPALLSQTLLYLFKEDSLRAHLSFWGGHIHTFTPTSCRV